MMTKFYPGKVLLFGEYSLLFGTKGIVLPFTDYCGRWRFNDSKLFDQDLLEFYNYGKTLKETRLYDWEHFKRDIDQGLEFQSSIPKGEGLGSSGALIAAFHDRYYLSDVKNISPGIDLNHVRLELAELESFHHQKSSGIDPLVSWIQRPVLLKGLNDIVVLNQLTSQFDWMKDQGINIFLIPTKSKRKTCHLVDLFRRNLEGSKFNNWFQREYCTLVDNVVDSFLSMNLNFFDNVKRLCHEQQKMLSAFMDQPEIRMLHNTLDEKSAAIKLCGAGGGGYFLLFTNKYNVENLKKLIPQFNLINLL